MLVQSQRAVFDHHLVELDTHLFYHLDQQDLVIHVHECVSVHWD